LTPLLYKHGRTTIALTLLYLQQQLLLVFTPAPKPADPADPATTEIDIGVKSRAIESVLPGREKRCRPKETQEMQGTCYTST
jgi:hypothetical protein